MCCLPFLLPIQSSKKSRVGASPLLLVPVTAAAARNMDEARGPPHILGTKLRMTLLEMHNARGPLHDARWY